MTVRPKIIFDHRKARSIEDVTDLVALLFPSNGNQQHAAAHILLALRRTKAPVSRLNDLQDGHGISRRTMERTRAKLARLGLIERVSWMNSRFGGRQGWMLSGRMSTALRALADRIDRWRRDAGPSRARKEEVLVELLRPGGRALRSPSPAVPAAAHAGRETEDFMNSA